MLGLLNLGWNVWSAKAKKKEDTPRLRVFVTESVAGFPSAHGPENVWYPVVTVQAEKGPVGIGTVVLWFADEADRRRFSLGSGPAGRSYVERLAGMGFSSAAPTMPGHDWDPFDMHVVLQTGAQRSWAFSVWIDRTGGDEPRRVSEGRFRMIAVVIRSDGGAPIGSEEFDHLVSWPWDDELPPGPL